MIMVSRKHLLLILLILAFCLSLHNQNCFSWAEEAETLRPYPVTLKILKEAYWAEYAANKNYHAYCRRALFENYPNIAYLFFALAASEKIHADNYKKLIISLGSTPGVRSVPVSIGDTKTNLRDAARNELAKINKTYPDILRRFSVESHDQAIVFSMYSWKSHKQHEAMINNIRKYSGIFFGPLSKKIESMNPNFYLCKICGSSIDEKPKFPCEICNYPLLHSEKLVRPQSIFR